MKNKLDFAFDIKHVHFIGIGGISMSGLAEILLQDGYTVSGSDRSESDITRHLASCGIDVKLGASAAHIVEGIDLVVYTAAIRPDNPELMAAREKNIPVIDRAKLLGAIMKGYEYSVAVSGVHGKTTTTAIVAELMLAAGLDPTISIGGYMETIGSNFRMGNSQYMVLEACEYHDSFLQFYPHVGIILNIDCDHMDYFGSLDGLVASFRKFAQNIPKEGALVIHNAIPCLGAVVEGLTCNIITYGEGGRFQAKEVNFDADGFPSFYIIEADTEIANVKLNLRGRHNIDNALAAAAVAGFLGVSPEAMVAGLEKTAGTKRRFEHKGSYKGISVVDDYAHHPTEIKATLEAATNGCYRRIICAFQPHTYTRTQNLMDEFSTAFDFADEVLILPTYASRELSTDSDPHYLAKLLAQKIVENDVNARFVESFMAASDWIKENAEANDLLITMGAGDIHILGEGLISGEL